MSSDAASAAASAAGGLMGLAGEIYNTRTGKKEAQKNRDFQERMANTAHQREVADLRKAGLNPVLSATGGSGANTPAGAVADSRVDSSKITNAMNDIATGVQTRKLVKLQQETQAASTNNITADTIQKAAQTIQTNAQTKLTNSQTKKNLVEGTLNEKANSVINNLNKAVMTTAIDGPAQIYGNITQKLKNTAGSQQPIAKRNKGTPNQRHHKSNY